MSGADVFRGHVVVVSSEHGGNHVPAPYARLFEGRGALLASHRGWDPGTAALASKLAAALHGRLHVARVTRLLVDLNRSPLHPRVFSEVTRTLPVEERNRLLRDFHAPHRERVREDVASALRAGRTVLHLGVHSFTPVLDGDVRTAELALLYDPSRPAEAALVADWTRGLRARLPHLRVRRNYPYRGTADGLTTTFRGSFPDPRYLGIEIEVSQRLLEPDGSFPDEISDALVRTLPFEEHGVLHA